MALIASKQYEKFGSYSGSFSGSFTGSLGGSDASRIVSGSVTASVDSTNYAFKVNTTSSTLLNLSLRGNLTLGNNVSSSNDWSFSHGNGTNAFGDYSHAEGTATTAGGLSSHAEGFYSSASALYSHAEGAYTTASGIGSHAEGLGSFAQGIYSHAEGGSDVGPATQRGPGGTASGRGSHAEGVGTLASGVVSHAEGLFTTASSVGTHTEGFRTIASGLYSHAEGNMNAAIGGYSHAEGNYTTASGLNSSTKGYVTVAAGVSSFAGGAFTVASGSWDGSEGVVQWAIGKYNALWNTSSLFVIGNGTSEANRRDLAQFNSQSIEFYSDFSVAGNVSSSGRIVASSFTGSLQGTSSWSINAQTSSYLLGTVESASYALTAAYAANAGGGTSLNLTGSANYIAIFSNSSSLATSSIFQSGAFTSIRNATAPEDPNNPDILYVNGAGVSTYNLISAHGDSNTYVQINIQNYNNSVSASSDIVATADNGNESSNYIDMGINSSGFTNVGNIGGQNDAYLYSTGNDLYIGNTTPGKEVIIFNGGFDAQNKARIFIHDQGTIGINTATYNAINPPSLDIEAPNPNTTNLVQAAGEVDNYLQIAMTNRSGGTTASADLVVYNNIDPTNQMAGFLDMGINSTNYVSNATYPGSAGDSYLFTDSHHLILGTVSASGDARITLFAGGVSEDTNAKLILYGSGRHIMSGSLNATNGFTGSLYGTSSWSVNSLTASYYGGSVVSSSYSNTSISSSYSINSTSASYSNISTSSSYAATASVAPAYLPLIGGTINGNLIVNGTASISYLNVLYETASVIYSSGSNQFGDALSDTQTLYGFVVIPSGSLNVSGSITARNGFTGSLQGTSSWATNSISASYYGGSVVSSSYALTASYWSGSAPASVSSSYSLSSSFSIVSTSSSYALSSSYSLAALSASYSSNSLSSSYALSSSYSFNANSASYSLSSSYSFSSTSASFASTVLPAGSNTQVQYNFSGSLYADPNMTWNSGSRTFTLTGDGGSNTTPVFRIIDGSTSTKRIVQFDAPVTYNTSGRQSFPFVFQWHPSSNGDGTTNNVAKWGYNIDGFTAGQSGLFYSLEPDWVSGGLPYREAHLTYTYPSGSQVRIFSSTIQQRSTLNATTNQWDFRATTFAVKDLEDNDYFTVQKSNGTGSAAGGWIGGYQPTFELYDRNAAKRWVLQNNGSGGSIIQGGLAINSYYGTEGNLLLTNVGGTTGASVIRMQYVDGNSVVFSVNGSSVGGTYANTFYLYDTSTGRVFLKNYKTSGNLILGDGSATDHGEYVQIIGTSYHSTTSSFAGPVNITGSINLSSSLYHTFKSVGASGATTAVLTVATQSYTAGFFDYTVNSGSNARAGTLIAVWNGSSVQYTDNSTTDIGSTTDVTMSAALSSGNIVVNAITNTSAWNVKATYRLI